MGAIERITDKVLGLFTKKNAAGERVPLDRATYLELFFDLVFIFCARSILPILTDAEGGSAGWYTYYTFWFTFALMLQIWFNATLFMNRFGNGGALDAVYLFTTMFLLFVMMKAASVDWAHYAIYNICWVLITVNTIIHWMIRYGRIANPSRQIKNDTRNAMLTLIAQAALVLISHLLPKTPAQTFCLAALLLGFLYWYVGGVEKLDLKSREHLTERCALLMVLMFGETLLGFSTEVTTDLQLFSPIMSFLLIVGMFLIYLNEITNLLDIHAINKGMLYMALSAWMTFCIANVTASFEMMVKGITLMGISGRIFFGVSVAVFLLSFFLYTPFTKYKRPAAKWTVARVVASLLVLAQMLASELISSHMLDGIGLTNGAVSTLSVVASVAMVIVAVAAVYLILVIDCIAIRRSAQRVNREHSSS